ncbi:MAG: hypothetical protein P8Y24_11150, partial [Gammaproteobacteria bacterium]
MTDITFSETKNYRYRGLLSFVGMGILVAMILSLSACSSNDDSSPTVLPDPPGVPINFTVDRTPETTLSATLNWSAPVSGGEVVSYEIYRSTTAGTVFQDANLILSIPAEAGKLNYTYIDNVGLTNV